MIGKLFRFWLAGLPAFVVAIPLNFVLVTHAHVAKPLAYMLVLFCQVTINFFACRMFVFPSAPGAPVWRQYTEFVAGIGLFRFLDWAVYVALVQFFGAGYLAVQILNVFVFSLLKYQFSDRVFRRHRGHETRAEALRANSHSAD